MKRFGSVLVTILILCVLSAPAAHAIGFDAEEAAKSVLMILAYEDESDEEPSSTGSGFVAFNSSTLITNYHVIEDAVEIYALDDNDDAYMLAYVLCADADYDIAILEFESVTPLAPLELYPSDRLKRGESVVAIGSPEGFKNTVSTGIISSLFEEDGVPYILTTAPISPGSSGGALLNDEGKVIGVTSATYESVDEYGEETNAQNLNFAVNIAVAQAMYNAWDGTRSSVANCKTSARMDFTGVYQEPDRKEGSEPKPEAVVTALPQTLQGLEPWTCPNCGTVDTDPACKSCGTERPAWTCVCGQLNYTKYCGECGRKAEDLAEQLNRVLSLASGDQYDEAIQVLLDLGLFDSGTYPTDRGTHAAAGALLPEMYYRKGAWLESVSGDPGAAAEAFRMAGSYMDAAERMQALQGGKSGSDAPQSPQPFPLHRQVKMEDIRITGWWVLSPEGELRDDSRGVRTALYDADWSLVIAGTDGQQEAWLLFSEYADWGWDESEDLLADLARDCVLRITEIEGETVENTIAPDRNVPVIDVESVEWMNE